MLAADPLKLALKRGALVAAANWPVTIAQAMADALFKIVVAAPVTGGVFLVALVVGAEPDVLLSLAWADLASTLAGALLSRPFVLAAFLSSLVVAVSGGSLFVFLVKGGTVGVLVRGEREAGPIEHAPVHLHHLTRASRFSMDAFLEPARSLFTRYTRLGVILMAVYLVSGAGYLAALAGMRLTQAGIAAGLLLTVGFVFWITIVNLLYLLMQLVIAADDCSVAAAATRVSLFLKRERGSIAAVFLVVLAIVIAATGASVLATAALGLIGFVPFLWLVVIPLQLVAWLLRALVFQFIGTASIGAYLNLYRTSATLAASGPVDQPAVSTYAAADLHRGRI